MLVAVSCQDPTQVMIEVRTNVEYRAGIVTSFTVGAPGQTEDAPPATETREEWRRDGVGDAFVGSLAVVPGEDDESALSVKIVMGVRKEARDCTSADGYQGCIVARRRLRYAPNTLLRLPVVLYSRCEGVPCTPDTTCNVSGLCVPADVSCETDDTCRIPTDAGPTLEDRFEAFDVTTESSSGTPDASLDADAAQPAGDADAADTDASDATSSADATDAAGDGAVGTPDVVDCRNEICTSEICVYRTTTNDGCCYAAGGQLACSMTGDDVVLLCDGNEDCTQGKVCCLDFIAGGGSSCAPSCGAGQAIMCHSTNACASGACTGAFDGYFKYCQ